MSDFPFDMYRLIRDYPIVKWQGDDIICSPAAMKIALGILFEGADGEARELFKACFTKGADLKGEPRKEWMRGSMKSAFAALRNDRKEGIDLEFVQQLGITTSLRANGALIHHLPILISGISIYLIVIIVVFIHVDMKYK